MTMPRRPRALLATTAAVACAALGAAPAAQAISAQSLDRSLDKRTARLGSHAGAYVVDLDAGTTLYAHGEDRRLSPASNEKLFTTATALLKFGPDGVLTTQVRAAPGASIDEDGVLDGDLYLVGDGDPSLNDVALKKLARDLTTKAGLKRVTGRIRGDESVFDTRRGSYDSRYEPDSDLGGWLGGLTWGHGRAFPGGPATVAAARLQKFLAARDVKVGRPARVAPRSVDASDGSLLASVDSPPMSQLIATTNQPSDNFYAETLLKDLALRYGAGRGTTTGGLRVVRAQLKAFGITPTIRDGSGLSRADLTTPRQIVTLLRRMHDGPYGEEFEASLAIPGRVGTLARRMRGTAADGDCHAKTGTLRGVSALSGYCRAANGHTIAFSFLENRVNALAAKALEDQMVPLVARYDG
jgi:D-alanyl-D-alanine carboxypeptidase/D-alanyl-D-alanine-endopeptidase (penicillin-binding protein 4)